MSEYHIFLSVEIVVTVCKNHESVFGFTIVCIEVSYKLIWHLSNELELGMFLVGRPIAKILNVSQTGSILCKNHHTQAIRLDTDVEWKTVFLLIFLIPGSSGLMIVERNREHDAMRFICRHDWSVRIENARCSQNARKKQHEIFHKSSHLNIKL